MNNSDLVPKKNGVITKIREKLFLLFHHKEREDSTGKTIDYISSFNTIDANTYKKNETEKRRILGIYEKFKKKQISVYEIPRQDLRLIKEIMLKEIEIKESKLDELQTEINMSMNNIKYFNNEIQKYKKTSEY